MTENDSKLSPLVPIIVVVALLVVCVAIVVATQNDRVSEKTKVAVPIAPSMVVAATKIESKPEHTQYVLSAKDFDGFEKCNNDALARAIRKLAVSGRSFVKEEGVWWIRPVKGEFAGLPVIAIGTGVCDESGEVGCGWAMYKAIVISSSLDDVKSNLIDKFGDNFTSSERDAETNVTLRPVLEYGESVHESILFCDSGWL